MNEPVLVIGCYGSKPLDHPHSRDDTPKDGVLAVKISGKLCSKTKQSHVYN